MSSSVLNNKINQRQPLKLLKNKSYPTYQLYATVLNKKMDVEKAMVIAILETMSWLRKRFRELEIPDEINFPEPNDHENISLNDFKSFSIIDGYVAEAIFLKEKSIWSFHLIEPDLGPEPGNENQKRKPVPGRVFETNIAYIINNGRLECGFKTICSEPVNTHVHCEVFRLAVVKSIINNKDLGLEQILTINQEWNEINSNDKVDNIVDYIRNEQRQLPFVLLVEKSKDININNIKVEIKDPSINIDEYLMRNFPAEIAITKENSNLCDDFQEGFKEIVKHKMGYAQFGFLPSKYLGYFNNSFESFKLSLGDIHVFYPEQFCISDKIYRNDYIILNTDNFLKELEDEIQNFPKFKNIKFGNVKFINESRIEELNYIIEISKSKEDIAIAYREKIRVIEQNNKIGIDMLNNEISERKEKIERLKLIIEELDSKDEEWKLKIEKMESDFNLRCEKLKREILRKDKLLDRPKKTHEIPEWVEKHFSNRLVFHNKAKNLIINTPNNEVDIDLLCDAIEFLAHEYLDEKMGKISLDERNIVCSELYNRSFEVTPSGNMSIKRYKEEYKIKYGTGYTGRPVEVPLDLHLKVGNDNNNILRIYFYYDKEKKIVVIGSLPKHLRTSIEN